MRIELVGGLGVGKSTLAETFRKRGCIVVSEDISANPFLEGCYKDLPNYELPSQIWFVQEKFRELLENQGNAGITVYDQSLMNTRAYINSYLKDNEEREVMYSYMDLIENRMGYADVYLYLDLSVEKQYARIKYRNRKMEQGVKRELLEKIKQEIEFYTSTYPNVIRYDIENIGIDDYKDIVQDVLSRQR
jgi:deoxyadenosine/deoxycytidine kinase